MPITRSNKDVPRHNETSSEAATETTATRTEATTSSGETRTETTGTTSSDQQTATTTGTTQKTTTTAETDTSNRQKKKDGNPKEDLRSNMTMVPMGPPRAPSVRSTKSRKKELEAKEELARLELEQAKAATALARAKLELLQNEDAASSEEELEPEDRAAHVQNWVQTTVREEIIMDDPRDDARHRPSEQRGEIRTFAKEIVKALQTHQQPPKFIHELPYFDGSSSEWVAFKTVYEDTAAMFNSVQNMSRIRKAVKGAAREAIKSLLYSACSPSEVMEALRRRFGRPEALVLGELEKIKVLPKPTDNARDVCVYANQVNNCVAAIKGLDKPQYLHSPEIVKLIVDKLPPVIRYRWYDFAAEKSDQLPELVNIADFLNREADRCGAFAAPESLDRNRRPQMRQAAHATMEESQRSREGDSRVVCQHCEGDHYLTSCKKFLNASVPERWDIAKNLRLCFKCLRSTHRKETCKRPGCGVCKRWHHRLLHLEQAPERAAQPKKEESKAEVITNLVATVSTNKAYLKMIPVKLYGTKGAVTVLALLDEGSTISLLDEEVAKEIGAVGPTEPFTIEMVGGKKITNANSKRLKLKISGVHQKRATTISGVRTIEGLKLTPQCVNEVNVSEYPHLKNIAHLVRYEQQSPKLLIGQDNWELIVTRYMKKGKRGQPVASMTSLGWVLHGRDVRAVNFVDRCFHVNTAEDDLEKLIKEHFSVESLGVAPKRPSTDADEKALGILNRTSVRLNDGRFQVGLLWKNEDEHLPESRSMATRRLLNLERKFEKNKDLEREYSMQVEHLIREGYAEEAPVKKEKKTWYLPHFAVSHPQKKKLRVVFDAAAKAGGKSLNDMLLPGPDLLQSLFGVLLRFREGPVALAADIKEMFLQIRIRPEERDCLRFLWRDGNKQCKEYRMTSVIFGATSSPCTAIYVKNKNAEEAQEDYPDAARAIVRNHYMDDYLQSFRNAKEARRVASEVNEIHKKAGFELRGWASNEPPAISALSSEVGKKEISIANQEEKTLGMKWLTCEDALGFNMNLRNTPEAVTQGSATPTKRQVTSAVMSTFDPMGIIAPVLIQGKKLLQNIWRSGVGWDDEIKPQEIDEWRNYVSTLRTIVDLQIPRCIAPHNTEGELHVFCDASESAYAAAVYWKTTGQQVSVTLIAAKARVTPLKPISIPRLELQAALLATRLAHTVQEEMDIKIEDTTYWTDSTTVLSWITSDPRSFKTFVAHRLAEIEEHSKPQQWRWVPTASNPADDATRKIPRDFNASHRWFTGPAFLYLPEEQWPRQKNVKISDTTEEKKVTVATIVKTEDEATPDPTRFSSWPRLLRTTARVLQFIELCRPKERVNAASRKKNEDDAAWNKKRKTTPQPKKTTGETSKVQRRFVPIDMQLIRRAEDLIIARSQRESFEDERKKLSRSETLPKSSKLRKLDVTMEDGLLRLRGRIDAAPGVSRDIKRPAVIDGKHQVSKLLIAHYHRTFNHGNHATVINELRQKYCILGLRTVLRSLTSTCQWCKAYRAKPQDLPPGDLPIERLRHGAPPFSCTGVDYFGPMTVTVGRRHEKRWGVLFTCLTVRAVHIELAASLTTDSMILALRRFAARRGMPKTLYSDNGTNFVGANRELREAIENMKGEDIAAATEHQVEWKFIPPGAPHMGGAWERLVRSIKVALEVTLRERHPKEEVLHTLLLEAEHVVNSRPLTDVGLASEEALTPNHFLIGRSCGATSIGAFTDRDVIGAHTWRTAQRLADHFWSRWLREYLPTLTARRITGRPSERDLQVGDVVVVGDHTLPRHSWPRGTVQQVYPGPDGRVRVADILTNGGVMRRPSSRLVIVTTQVSPQPEDGATHEGETVGDKVSLNQ